MTPEQALLYGFFAGVITTLAARAIARFSARKG